LSFEHALQKCVDFWSKIAPASENPSASLLHPDDVKFLTPRLKRHFSDTSTAISYLRDRVKKSKLHFMVPPEPYSGDLRQAKVIVVQINPKLSELAFTRRLAPSYMAAWRRTLGQDFNVNESFPFEPLNPTATNIAYGGFTWWHGKFRRFVNDVCSSEAELHRRPDYLDTLSRVSRTLAAVDLVPYFSGSKPSLKALSNLPSVQQSVQLVKALIADGRKVLVATAHAEWKGVLGDAHENALFIKTVRTIRAGSTSDIGTHLAESLADGLQDPSLRAQQRGT